MKKLWMLTAMVSFFFLLSTAGASDLELIDIGQTLLRAGVCLLMFCGSMLGVYLCEQREERRESAARQRKSSGRPRTARQARRVA